MTVYFQDISLIGMIGIDRLVVFFMMPLYSSLTKDKTMTTQQPMKSEPDRLQYKQKDIKQGKMAELEKCLMDGILY